MCSLLSESCATKAYCFLGPLLAKCILESKVEDFSYIVNHAVEQPLDVNLDLPSQGKPIHGFTDTNVRKCRFGNGDAAMIDSSPLFAVGLCGFMHISIRNR